MSVRSVSVCSGVLVMRINNHSVYKVTHRPLQRSKASVAVAMVCDLAKGVVLYTATQSK